jgi:hypothetical protein
MGEYGIYGGFLAGAIVFAAGFLFAVKFNRPQAVNAAAQAVKKRRWNPKEPYELFKSLNSGFPMFDLDAVEPESKPKKRDDEAQ